jgi:pectinesterase
MTSRLFLFLFFLLLHADCSATRGERRYDLVVAPDGSGHYRTVQEAIDAVPDYRKNVRTTILIRTGTYREKLVVPESKINLSLIGEDGAVLTYDDYANKPNRFGENIGTSGSASCYIYAPDFYAENITFANSAGAVGQAVACFVSADRAFFKRCRFLGFQDTLYTYGKGCRQYYEDCYIEGTVDFIFGWSTAVFLRCHIHSLGNGYIAAPSTDREQTYGYLFYDCRMTAAPGVDHVFLSRPWRPYGQAVFVRCHLESHIVPAGFDNWGNASNERTARYAEYQSSGDGANPQARAPFARRLTSLEGYEPAQALAGSDGWNPMANGNVLLDIKR